jgi:hypothetical protein
MSEECAAGTAHDSPPFPPFPRPPSYPLRPEHAQWAVERLANQIAPMRSVMAKKYSLELLEALLKQGLRQGRLPLAKRAVEAANKGDYIADSALRAVAAELQTALLQKRDLAPGHQQAIGYYQGVHDRPPLRRKRGRYGEHDAWVRKVAICAFVLTACAWLGLQPTRSRASRLGGRHHSGISLVVAALASLGIRVEEETFQRHTWYGVIGELVRQVPEDLWFLQTRSPAELQEIGFPAETAIGLIVPFPRIGELPFLSPASPR